MIKFILKFFKPKSVIVSLKHVNSYCVVRFDKNWAFRESIFNNIILYLGKETRQFVDLETLVVAKKKDLLFGHKRFIVLEIE